MLNHLLLLQTLYPDNGRPQSEILEVEAAIYFGSKKLVADILGSYQRKLYNIFGKLFGVTVMNFSLFSV